MEWWVDGVTHIDGKIKMVNFLSKSNIPSFHHSIIPFSKQIRKPKNPFILSGLQKSGYI